MNANEVILKLEKVAKANDDRFRYQVEITLRRGLPWYSFSCIEAADGHTFVAAEGDSVDSAARNAVNQLSSALQDWGYKE